MAAAKGQKEKRYNVKDIEPLFVPKDTKKKGGKQESSHLILMSEQVNKRSFIWGVYLGGGFTGICLKKQFMNCLGEAYGL
jgi:hypothetical protein